MQEIMRERDFSELVAAKSINFLIIINEPIGEMVLGKNSTLAYIAASLEISERSGGKVYVYNLQTDFENSLTEISVLELSKDQKICHDLVKNFKKENQQIVNLAAFGHFSLNKNRQFSEIVPDGFDTLKITIKPSEIDLIIQRIEPMKWPFPPVGDRNVDDILKTFRALFPKKIFNCPIDLNDKETPQIINRLLCKKKLPPIAIPTQKFRLDENYFTSLVAAINAAKNEYRLLFPQSSSQKIVIKPQNSAQSLGVFAIEFSEFGFDLKNFEQEKISTLADRQIYQVKSDISAKELAKIVEILCFIQSAKADKKTAATAFLKNSLLETVPSQNKKDFHRIDSKFSASFSPMREPQPTLQEDAQLSNEGIIANFCEKKILTKARNLFNDEILVQPFLEGVKKGDVRVNILKDENDDFYHAGSVFRSSNHQKDEQGFTTGYSSGGSSIRPINDLEKLEQEDLQKNLTICLGFLNNELRYNYRHSLELGIDFICVGNGQVFLGEINHHCQGLIPLSEAMKKFSADKMQKKDNYDGGLGLVKNAILSVIKRAS